jgi:hypothetical protein
MISHCEVLADKRQSRATSNPELTRSGLLTFSRNVTLDGCVDHQEGIADDETHAFFTQLMDEGGVMLWGRVTYDMVESYWPAVACGEGDAPPAMRECPFGSNLELCESSKLRSRHARPTRLQ